MSSSTSNSRRGLKVVALLALLFFALEGVTRVGLFRASKDLRRFATYPARARALGRAPGKRIAFIGNSLTERGIDLELFARELSPAVGPVSDEMFVADGSHINTWYWIVERELWKQAIKPDLLILNFYENGLEDGKRLEIGRLAQFFTTAADWPALFRYDVTTLESRVDFLLSSFWATFAVRDRIKERVLDFIPGYQPYTEQANALNFENEKHAKSAPVAAPPVTREALRRFVARAREHGVTVLFVAFPSLKHDPAAELPYDVPDETRQIIAGAGMLYLDLRKLPELDPKTHYADDIHLNEAGRAIYTRRLAAEVPRLITAK